MSDEPKISEEEAKQIALALPGLVASAHGCTPDQCDLVEDTTASEWLFIARGVLRKIEALRLEVG